MPETPQDRFVVYVQVATTGLWKATVLRALSTGAVAVDTGVGTAGVFTSAAGTGLNDVKSQVYAALSPQTKIAGEFAYSSHNQLAAA
jgi:hypothetical protein